MQDGMKLLNRLLFMMLLLGIWSNSSAMNDGLGGDQKTAGVSKLTGDQQLLVRKTLAECKDPQTLATAMHTINTTMRDSNNRQLSIDLWRDLLKGIDVRIKDKDDNTVLHCAALLGYASVCKILVHAADAKAMTKAQNNKEKIPLELAKDNKVRQALVGVMDAEDIKPFLDDSKMRTASSKAKKSKQRKEKQAAGAKN